MDRRDWLSIENTGRQSEPLPVVLDPMGDPGLSPERRNGIKTAPSGSTLVAPLTARPVPGSDDEWEVVDLEGQRVAVNLHGRNSAAAIATLLNNYLEGDGLCLVHLTEMADWKCLACREGWCRSPFSVRR